MKKLSYDCDFKRSSPRIPPNYKTQERRQTTKQAGYQLQISQTPKNKQKRSITQSTQQTVNQSYKTPTKNTKLQQPPNQLHISSNQQLYPNTLFAKQYYYFMKCGHKIDRCAMRDLAANVKKNNKSQIRCPGFIAKNVTCNTLWSMSEIRRSDLLTQKEINQLEQTLSANWVKQHSRQCPNCKLPITKNNKHNKVGCPGCKFSNFCYLCSQPWMKPITLQVTKLDWDTLSETTSTYNFQTKYCGNQQCYQLNYEISSIKINKVYLTEKNNQQAVIAVSVFEERCCPFCAVVIKNREGIKHVSCHACSGEFCWICLGKPVNQMWGCGIVHEYCGVCNNNQKAEL